MILSRLAIGDDRPEFTKYLWNVKQLNYEWDGMEVFLMAHLFQDSSQIFVWMLIDVDRPWMGACVSRQPDHRSPFGLVEKECIRTVRLIIVFSPKPLYFTGIPVSLMFIRTKSLASEFWEHDIATPSQLGTGTPVRASWFETWLPFPTASYIFRLAFMIFRNKHICQTLINVNGRPHILLVHIDS